jgi:hypothetical protein
MTAVLNPTQKAWHSMPGWGIVADLTPSELVTSRQLRQLRKVIGAFLIAVVVLCAAGYAYAWTKNNSAQDALDKANAQSTQLTAEQARYAGVTRIETTVAGIQAKVASLMKTDVDVAQTIAKIRTALPGTMAITQLSITFTSAATAGPAGAAATAVDGHLVIGKVTMSGAGRTLDDLSAYVDALGAVPGVANLLPSSNTATKGGTQFSLSFDLTDQLYTHRYDPSKSTAPTTGSK